jgi:SlyX protein
VSDTERIIQLESIVSHLEHQLDQLNGVVRDQHAQIEQLEQTLQRFADRLEALTEEPEERDPLQERPPHY